MKKTRFQRGTCRVFGRITWLTICLSLTLAGCLNFSLCSEVARTGSWNQQESNGQILYARLPVNERMGAASRFGMTAPEPLENYEDGASLFSIAWRWSDSNHWIEIVLSPGNTSFIRLSESSSNQLRIHDFATVFLRNTTWMVDSEIAAWVEVLLTNPICCQANGTRAFGQPLRAALRLTELRAALSETNVTSRDTAYWVQSFSGGWQAVWVLGERSISSEWDSMTVSLRVGPTDDAKAYVAKPPGSGRLSPEDFDAAIQAIGANLGVEIPNVESRPVCE